MMADPVSAAIFTRGMCEALKRWDDATKKRYDAGNEEVIRIVYEAFKAECKKP